MTRNMIEMHKATIREAFEAKIRKCQGERAAVVRQVAVLRAKGPGYMADNAARRGMALDAEIARLQGEADKALARLDGEAKDREAMEFARRERERFAIECIEAGINDFTASDEDDTIRAGLRLARVAA